MARDDVVRRERAQRERLDEPLDLEALRSGFAAQGLEWEVVEGAELDAWIGDSPVLTDDFAPVDQLLTPYPTARRPVA